MRTRVDVTKQAIIFGRGRDSEIENARLSGRDGRKRGQGRERAQKETGGTDTLGDNGAPRTLVSMWSQREMTTKSAKILKNVKLHRTMFRIRLVPPVRKNGKECLRRVKNRY